MHSVSQHWYRSNGRSAVLRFQSFSSVARCPGTPAALLRHVASFSPFHTGKARARVNASAYASRVSASRCIYAASVVACLVGASPTVFGCGASQPATQDVTLAEYSQDDDGSLGVWVDADGGVQGAMGPWGSGDPLNYLSASPCMLIHVRATVNGVECTTKPGGASAGPSGLASCAVPTFDCLSVVISSDINIRVWDKTKTWTFQGDLPKPTGSIVGSDTVHIGTWADVALNQSPEGVPEIAFLPDADVPGFDYGISTADGGCGGYVDSTDGGAPLPPDAACPLVIEPGGLSFLVPDTPGAGTLVVSGYPDQEITECDGPGTCSLFHGYSQEDPTARMPIRIVP